MAQSGERLNGIEEVGGSTPPSSTRPDEIKNFHVEVCFGSVVGFWPLPVRRRSLQWLTFKSGVLYDEPRANVIPAGPTDIPRNCRLIVYRSDVSVVRRVMQGRLE